MSLWTIDGQPIYKVTRKLRSLAVDTVTFEAAQNFDAPPMLALGSDCAIARDGAPWFAGVVTKNAAHGSGTAESQQYEISGPWWFLEKLVFHQSWNILTNQASQGQSANYSLVATPSTRVILGQDITGAPMGVADQITEILDWAIEKAHAPIAAGIIDQPTVVVNGTPTPVYPPANEQVNITCAEAIKAMLRWLPDAVGWWDYSVLPPRLNIRRASALSPVFVALQSPCTGISITPRNDLQVPSVCINYEQTITVDTDTYTQFTQDYQPSGATGLELGALCATIELSGPKTSYQHQPIVAAHVPGSVDSDPDSSGSPNPDGDENPKGCCHWWRSKLPWMRQYLKSDGTTANIPYGDISIVGGSHFVDLDLNWGTSASESGGGTSGGSDGLTTGGLTTGDLQTGSLSTGGLTTGTLDDSSLDNDYTQPAPATGSDAAGAAETAPDTLPKPLAQTPPSDISDVPRELLSGAIGDWMGVKAAFATAAAFAKYTPAGTSDPAVAAMFAGGNRAISWSYTATDAVTQTYRKLNGYNAGEAVPNGVAEMLYQGASILYYEGRLTSEQVEIGGAPGMGTALNLFGGREEWRSMNTPVQSLTEEVDAGKTVVEFGPPKHLSPQDLVELLRGTRRRKVSSRGNGGERTTGTPGKAANVMGPTGHPAGKETSPPAPGGALQNDFSLYDAGATMSSRSPTGANLGIVCGIITDTTSGANWADGGGAAGVPTGFTAGQNYTQSVDASDVVAYLIITYSTDSPYNITSVTVDTDTTVPANTAGTFNLPLGNFSIDGTTFKITVGAGAQGIGSQSYYGCSGSPQLAWT